MTFPEKVDAVAEALWRHRGREVPAWKKMGWRSFCIEKPDIADIYRQNAKVAVEAIENLPVPA